MHIHIDLSDVLLSLRPTQLMLVNTVEIARSAEGEASFSTAKQTWCCSQGERTSSGDLIARGIVDIGGLFLNIQL